MLSAELRKLLIAQIGNELAAHELYLAIAIYFERQSLDGWGKLFRHQSVEEAQHAQKIIDFLIDNDVEFDLPALKATSTRFGSPLAAAKRALESERTVAGQFDRAATVAVAGRRPPRLRVPAVVHRRAGRGGAQAPADRRPDRQRHQPVPGRGPARRVRVGHGAERATTTCAPSRSGSRRASTGRSTSPTTTRRGRRCTSARRRGSARLLGDRVRLLEHVGSTSVPGLAAKPIIDIVLGVADSADEARLRPADGGRRLRPADPRAGLARAPAVQGPGHRRQPARLQRPARPRSSGCSPSATGSRSDDDERRRYEATKRELAAARVDLRPGLRRRQGRGRRGDHRAGARRRRLIERARRVDIERASRYRPTHAHEPPLLLSMPGMTLPGR